MAIWPVLALFVGRDAMKHTDPYHLLNRATLCFVRDERPTVEQFLERFGGPHGQAYHVLRKHGIIILEDGRLRLNRRHLSPDGKEFVWGNNIFHLDSDRVDTVRWLQEGPPSYSETP